jgi:hypothetical protein
MSNIENFLNYRESIFSGIGNDGIINEIFKRINLNDNNKLFVEFGAWDGIYNSNTRNLFLNGWSGIFIEPSIERFKQLDINYKNEKKLLV